MSLNIDRSTKEAEFVELYRRDLISQHELCIGLGITRLEVDALLTKHGVVEDLPTVVEYESALSRLRKLTGD